MTSSIVSPQPAATPAAVKWRPGWPSRILALTPLWVLIISPLAAPRFFEPLGGEYPNILGLNLGVIVVELKQGTRVGRSNTSRIKEGCRAI